MARKMEKITDECTYLIDDGAGASGKLNFSVNVFVA